MDRYGSDFRPMRLFSLKYSLGLAGVAANEKPIAVAWGKGFEWPMLFLAIWIPLHWYLEYSGLLTEAFSTFAYWIVWLVFVSETTILCWLVHRKKRYLSRNWMNLVIIVVGFPQLWQVIPLAGSLRMLRLIVLVGVLVKLSRSLVFVLRKNRLGTTLLASTIVIAVAGIVISLIDPAIDNPFEGIWWAWVTVTTVGYGDIVPTSVAGRIFGGFLILLGVGLFALLTANFSAALIAKEVGEVEKEVEEVEEEESLILKKLKSIDQRLDHIERQLNDKGRQYRE